MLKVFYRFPEDKEEPDRWYGPVRIGPDEEGAITWVAERCAKHWHSQFSMPSECRGWPLVFETASNPKDPDTVYGLFRIDMDMEPTFEGQLIGESP